MIEITDNDAKKYEFYSELEISLSRCKFFIFLCKETEEEVVVKAFPKSIFSEADVNREIVTQRYAASDFVLPIIGNGSAKIYDIDYYIIIEPYCDSDLALSLENFDYEEKIIIIESILKAVADIHNKHIIHRDIKLDNFFITKDKKILLADFGSAHFENDPICTINTNDKGTFPYMAPECWTNSFDTTARDIYSLGICIFYIATNHLPFNTKKGDEEEYKKLHTGLSIPPICNSCFSWLNPLVKKMTNINPSNRVTIYKAITIFETLKKSSLQF